MNSATAEYRTVAVGYYNGCISATANPYWKFSLESLVSNNAELGKPLEYALDLKRRQQKRIIHRESKKRHHYAGLYPYQILTDFKNKFFHWHILWEIFYKPIGEIPPHLRRVPTLPCEI